MLTLVAIAQVMLASASDVPIRPIGPVSAAVAARYADALSRHEALQRGRSALWRPPTNYKFVIDTLTASDREIVDKLETSRNGLFQEAMIEVVNRNLQSVDIPLTRVLKDRRKDSESLITINALASKPNLGAKALRVTLDHPLPTIAVRAGLALQNNVRSNPKILKALYRYRELRPESGDRTALEAVRVLLSTGEGRSVAKIANLVNPLGPQGRYLYPSLVSTEAGRAFLCQVVADSGKYHGLRSWAMSHLATAEVKEAIPALRKAVLDPQSWVRGDAAKALMALKAHEAVPDLQKALSMPPSNGSRRTGIPEIQAALMSLKSGPKH